MPVTYPPHTEARREFEPDGALVAFLMSIMALVAIMVCACILSNRIDTLENRIVTGADFDQCQRLLIMDSLLKAYGVPIEPHKCPGYSDCPNNSPDKASPKAVPTQAQQYTEYWKRQSDGSLLRIWPAPPETAPSKANSPTNCNRNHWQSVDDWRD